MINKIYHTNKLVKHKLKIIFVSEYYYPHLGGIEIVIKEVAERLANNGHDIHVITCKLGVEKNLERLNGVTVHRVSVPKWGDRYWFDSFWAIPAIIRLCGRCDLIHAGCHNSAFPAWLVATILRKKKIVTIHELLGKEWISLSGINFPKAKLHEMSEKILASLCFDKYICVSKNSESQLKSMNPRADINKQIVIYNGIDNALFNASTMDGTKIRQNLKITEYFIYMSFGRPGISKGIEYLIGAVPLIRKILPNSKLLLILDTNPSNRYKMIVQMISDLHIEDQIILLKPVPRSELPNYIAAADCIVIPSLSEGFGLSAAEACAMRKPVVASKVGSLPEIISGQYVLIEPKNSEAIADGVWKVFRGEVQQIPFKVFDWNICFQQYLKTYDEIVKPSDY